MTCVRAGDLSHLLTIQSPPSTPDGQGGFTGPFTTHAEAWGKVEPLRGTEVQEFGTLYPAATHKVTMRFVDGVAPPKRILFRGGRILEIEAVRNLMERDETLELICQEKNVGG